MFSRWWIYPLIGLAALAVSLALVVGYAAVVAYQKLPSLDALTSYQPKIPLQIFSMEGSLIGEFGEEKRAFLKIDQTPDLLRKAIIAAVLVKTLVLSGDDGFAQQVGCLVDLQEGTFFLPEFADEEIGRASGRERV